MRNTVVLGAVACVMGLGACTGARIQSGGDGGHATEPQGREGDVCLPDEVGSVIACEDDSVQYCGYDSDPDQDDPVWGPCLDDVECEPGDVEECDTGIRSCTLIDGEPQWSDCWDDSQGETDITPLVIVFPGDTIEYARASTASFDLGGDCLAHDWPTATTPWLAIDLDRSGSIDDGRELFGSATRLRDGTRASHGFAALAELDADGDGRITPADPRFDELLLWSDDDGDRRSTHAEHVSLRARGIVAIPVAFDRDRRCDARGNCGIEQASVGLADGGAATVVDVHLACQ